MNATELQRQKLIDDIRAMPADALQKAAELIASLQQQTSVATSMPPEVEKPTELEVASQTESPYEAFKKAGLIGCIKDAPADLSVNYKQYLAEGLAEKYGNH